MANINIALAAAGAPAPPPPAWLNLGGGGPVTISALKTSILTRVQTSAGGGGVVGNALIAPNDYMQYGRVVTQFNNIGVDPFFIAHAVCPIGRHYSLADKKAPTTAVADPISAPVPAQGVPVFA